MVTISHTSQMLRGNHIVGLFADFFCVRSCKVNVCKGCFIEDSSKAPRCGPLSVSRCFFDCCFCLATRPGASLRFCFCDVVTFFGAYRGVLIPELSSVGASVNEPVLLGDASAFLVISAAAAIKACCFSRSSYCSSISFARLWQKRRASSLSIW